MTDDFKSPYVEEKEFGNQLSAEWKIDFDNKFLQIYVWDNLEILHKNTKFEVNDHLACYIGVPGDREEGLFGELHVVIDRFGAGLVAHELEHFVLDYQSYSQLCKILTYEETELLSKLMGDVTNAFWVKYYSFFGDK
jgi:hypothetical protein